MITINLSSGSVAGYGFDAAGRLVSMTQSSPGLSASWGYDSANQILTVQRNTGGSGAYFQTLTYDGVGNRVSVRLVDGTQTSYSYDAKNRLTQDATIGLNTHTYNYSFDANDNILTNSESGTLTTNTYDIANRLTTSLAGTAMTSYTFDVNGNNIGVSSTGLTTMGYDKENRLVTSLAAGTSVSYVYAGSGLKRTEWNAGTPTTLIWDGQDYLKEKS